MRPGLHLGATGRPSGKAQPRRNCRVVGAYSAISSGGSGIRERLPAELSRVLKKGWEQVLVSEANDPDSLSPVAEDMLR